jgi:gluconolactonase
MNGIHARRWAAMAAGAAGLALALTGAPGASAATTAATTAATSAATTAAATAATACPAIQAPVQVGDTGVALEGAVVDGAGRLYVTDLFGGRILRFDRPGGPYTVVATLPDKSGGGALALLPDGTLIVGSGADARVFLGDILKPGAIHKVDVTTGKLTTIATGLSAANGLAVAADGTIYATNDFASLIGKVSPDGKVNSSWTSFPSANGAVLSADGRYLYVSRTFWNPGVSRILVARPQQVESLLDLTGIHTTDAPDGLTLDSAGRPVVPANAAGYIFRIERKGVTCTLATGLGLSSVVVYGKGSSGFSAGHLYRAGFDGKIYEIPSGFDPGAVR